MDIADLLARLGVSLPDASTDDFAVRSPIDGSLLAGVAPSSSNQVEAALVRAGEAFRAWREVPAPQRGDLVRRYGLALRAAKADLGELVTRETGKILQEGLGEVQEMIDICDFAAGLSRQTGGLTLPSERPGHRLMELWQPIGPVGVISAFNFPAAVWAWNAALAWVCGDPVVWKPSPRTPLTALACAALFHRVAAEGPEVPEGLLSVLVGGSALAETLADDPRLPVISATGSCAMGRALAPRIAARFGRALLELGGNNGAIVCPSAHLPLVERAVLFAATGTAGQRCTTLRRLLVHEAVYAELVPRLRGLYARLAVGHPLDPNTLVGPLIDEAAFETMQSALAEARGAGARVCGGERVEVADCAGGFYVRPALVEGLEQTALVHRETFAPILYVLRVGSLDEALRLHNAVPQGLASSIFTRDFGEAERFLGPAGSDFGIANVNLGPSGAEIGGAFGGEKDTGGGRESGSDAWKSYMRRMTCTLNASDDLPLAQGIQFHLE